MGRIILIANKLILVKKAKVSKDKDIFWKGFAKHMLTKSAEEQQMAARELYDLFEFPDGLEKTAGIWDFLARGIGKVTGLFAKPASKVSGGISRKLGEASEKAIAAGRIKKGTKLADRAAGYGKSSESLKRFSTLAGSDPGLAAAKLGKATKAWALEPVNVMKRAWTPAGKGIKRRYLPFIPGTKAARGAAARGQKSLIGAAIQTTFMPQALLGVGGVAAGLNVAQGATGIGRPTRDIERHNALKRLILQQQYASQFADPRMTQVQQSQPLGY